MNCFSLFPSLKEYCRCKEGYFGVDCAQKIPFCDINKYKEGGQMRNGRYLCGEVKGQGTCFEGANTYHCSCSLGFTRDLNLLKDFDNCLLKADICNRLNSCGERENCYPSRDGTNFKCICKFGFTGNDCSTLMAYYDNWEPWRNFECQEKCYDKSSETSVVHSRRRKCINGNLKGQRCIGLPIEYKLCFKSKHEQLANRCIKPEWQEWQSISGGKCSKSCNGGIIKLIRKCWNSLDREVITVTKCQGLSSKTEICAQHDCPSDLIIENTGSWNSWGDFSVCDTECGIGEKIRIRTCSTGLGLCDGPAHDISACASNDCNGKPKHDNWFDWSFCLEDEKECFRVRSCNSSTCGGKARQQAPCIDQKCMGKSVAWMIEKLFDKTTKDHYLREIGAQEERTHNDLKEEKNKIRKKDFTNIIIIFFCVGGPLLIILFLLVLYYSYYQKHPSRKEAFVARKLKVYENDIRRRLTYARLASPQAFAAKVIREPDMFTHIPQASNLKSSCNTRPDNSDWRRMVRKTFGSVSIGKPWPTGEIFTTVQTLFLVGKTYDHKRDSLLTDEANLWKDMLIGNFRDHMLNDTIKTLMGLEWTYWKCSPMTHFVKVEENILINIPNLIKTVTQAAETGKGIIGSVRKGELVSRKGDLGLPVQTFPFHVLPIHLSAYTYVITAPALKQLLETSRYVRWLPLENVYFTGILPRIALIQIGHHPGLHYDIVHICDLKEKSSQFVAGKVAKKDLDILWKRFKDTMWTCQNGKLYHL
ncbi:DgyrCDS2414 [Dimorphilus gyrociliatus]|uniref:DgyrCDS2414 n=1 Tax=Dimorphilus gyrociliatus TaxID=2664684 RepID=A0A7I8VC69_9ANNE|nr:DgyrCDS2414 [Dimorphilus gyrociliatus]